MGSSPVREKIVHVCIFLLYHNAYYWYISWWIPKILNNILQVLTNLSCILCEDEEQEGIFFCIPWSGHSVLNWAPKAVMIHPYCTQNSHSTGSNAAKTEERNIQHEGPPLRNQECHNAWCGSTIWTCHLLLVLLNCKAWLVVEILKILHMLPDRAVIHALMCLQIDNLAGWCRICLSIYETAS